MCQIGISLKFQEWMVVALLRYIMLSQNTAILLHEMAFYRFWFDLSVKDIKLTSFLDLRLPMC